MQVLNVALGGSLHQHLPDLEGAIDHRQDRAQRRALAPRHARARQPPDQGDRPALRRGQLLPPSGAARARQGAGRGRPRPGRPRRGGRGAAAAASRSACSGTPSAWWTGPSTSRCSAGWSGPRAGTRSPRAWSPEPLPALASRPAMADEQRHTLIKTASYEAEPGEVGRVLLLYSGGLDTSVMLKWIQDEYEAEVVALTVNLGQPGRGLRGDPRQGAAAGRARLPRGRRARGVRARVRAAGDQGQRRSTAAATRCSPRSGGR